MSETQHDLDHLDRIELACDADGCPVHTVTLRLEGLNPLFAEVLRCPVCTSPLEAVEDEAEADEETTGRPVPPRPQARRAAP